MRQTRENRKKKHKIELTSGDVILVNMRIPPPLFFLPTIENDQWNFNPDPKKRHITFYAREDALSFHVRC